MIFRRKFTGLKCMILIFAVLFLSGITVGKALSKEGVKDTLVIGKPATPPGIDYEYMVHTEMWNIAQNVHDTGLHFKVVPSSDPKAQGILTVDVSDLENRLFESYEISPDWKTFTYHLRRGVKSAAGNELTTKDILYKWERGVGIGAFGPFFLDVFGIDSRDPKEFLTIVDDYTFKMQTDRPNYILNIGQANAYQPIPDSAQIKKHATKDDPWAKDWVAHHGGGFGPYYVEEWEAGQQVVLRSNPNYYMNKVPIDKVIFKVIPESSIRVAMIRNGTIDVATALSPREVKALEGAPGVKMVGIPSNYTIWLILNQKVFKPFANKLVRQALNYAAPRADIVNTAFLGYAKEWHTAIPSFYPGATGDEDWPYKYDLKKAKELLAEAGYPDGFEVELSYDAAYSVDETIAVLLQTNYEKIGVKVKLRKKPSASFADGVQSRQTAFSIWRDMPLSPDPNYACSLNYKGDAYANYGNYSNPTVDKMLNEGKSIVDKKARFAYHRKIVRELIDDPPCVFLVEPYYTIALRENVEGWNWDFCQDTDLSKVYFAAE